MFAFIAYISGWFFATASRSHGCRQLSILQLIANMKNAQEEWQAFWPDSLGATSSCAQADIAIGRHSSLVPQFDKTPDPSILAAIRDGLVSSLVLRAARADSARSKAMS